jgi:hypothetical protein
MRRTIYTSGGVCKEADSRLSSDTLVLAISQRFIDESFNRSALKFGEESLQRKT